MFRAINSVNQKMSYDESIELASIYVALKKNLVAELIHKFLMTLKSIQAKQIRIIVKVSLKQIEIDNTTFPCGAVFGGVHKITVVVAEDSYPSWMNHARLIWTEPK